MIDLDDITFAKVSKALGVFLLCLLIRHFQDSKQTAGVVSGEQLPSPSPSTSASPAASVLSTDHQ